MDKLAQLATILVDGAQTVAIVYVALLLRAATMSLSGDMRLLMGEVATGKIRLDEIEFRLGIDRESDGTAGASRRPRS